MCLIAHDNIWACTILVEKFASLILGLLVTVDGLVGRANCRSIFFQALKRLVIFCGSTIHLSLELLHGRLETFDDLTTLGCLLSEYFVLFDLFDDFLMAHLVRIQVQCLDYLLLHVNVCRNLRVLSHEAATSIIDRFRSRWYVQVNCCDTAALIKSLNLVHLPASCASGCIGFQFGIGLLSNLKRSLWYHCLLLHFTVDQVEVDVLITFSWPGRRLRPHLRHWQLIVYWAIVRTPWQIIWSCCSSRPKLLLFSSCEHIVYFTNSLCRIVAIVSHG